MTKSTITKTWVGGLAVFAVGVVVAIVGVFLMLAYGGTFSQIGSSGKYDFTPSMNGTFWTGVGIIVAGGVVTLVGGVVQLVAYVGGLVNSYALREKTWFWVLAAGGLLSLAFAPVGFAVMVAYVVAAPDGREYRQTLPAPASSPGQMATT